MTTAEPMPASRASNGYDVARLRRDFPVLHQEVHGKPLVYLDNAATSQKPTAVIDAVADYYRKDNSNVHRGVHELSMRATDAFEEARRTMRAFLNASKTSEVVFVRGVTEGINLVAQSYGRARLSAGDEIVVSHMEHHSNIVPWQILCEQTGAKLRVVPIDDSGAFMYDEFEALLGDRTRIVAVGHVSNALGSVNPIQRIAAAAHDAGAIVVVDGAQSAPHMAIDVRALDVDFYAVSSHKMYGPTGIGALYGREALLEEMPPYQGGGDMIRTVSFEKTEYNELPYKFEAGTPNIAGAIGMAAAAQYLSKVGLDAIAAHEHDLLEYATERFRALDGIRLIGTAPEKAAVLSFVIDGVHAHDVGTVLDLEGIAVRTGHHCAEPVMTRFGVPATARASFGLYNTRDEVDALVAGIQKVQGVFA